MLFQIKQNREYRDSNFNRIINKYIQNYINNGSKGILNLANEPISKLPNNLKKVGDDLDLFRTNITELPNNLKKVGNNLYIEHTNISELPNDIVIHGNLYCWLTPLSRKYSKEEIKNKYNIHGKVYY